MDHDRNHGIRPAGEVPQNGIAGLRHWRQDIVAGLLVSLVSLPLSLGIAVASGAPPITGLISAIIAGLVMPFLGGTFVTISGPAAGLAPVLYIGMAQLGGGDLKAGYPLLLAAICVTGFVQILLSMLKAARFSALFPTAAVEGMLAAIGLLIIAKELPHLLGVQFAEHDFFPLLLELPARLREASPDAVLIGVSCLILCVLLSTSKIRVFRLVPPPLVVVAFGILMGWLLGLNEALTIHVPDHLLDHGLVLPDFAQLTNNSALWSVAAITIATLTMVDGVESLATAAAIDRIDPYRRKSEPNRVLFAMGVSNMLSSLAGGLTVIPGGVKSKVCIMAGGRTLWANFYNAIFLILYISAFSGLINLIPYSALAAVLIYTGYKMCEPQLWKHTAEIGLEQLVVFSVTVVATLFTDLLWGIIAGMAAKLVISSLLAGRADAAGNASRIVRPVTSIIDLFRNPVTKSENSAAVYDVYFGKPMVCFNAIYVNRELLKIPPDVHRICLHITDSVTLIDHTSCDNLLRFVGEFNQHSDNNAEIVGLERLSQRSRHAAALRFSPRGSRVLQPASQGTAMCHGEPATQGRQALPVADTPLTGSKELS